MNRDEAKDFLPLVQALASGKTIQVFDGNGWLDCRAVLFIYSADKYRIKPEPLELSVWVGPNGSFTTQASATQVDSFGWRLVRMREIV